VLPTLTAPPTGAVTAPAARAVRVEASPEAVTPAAPDVRVGAPAEAGADAPQPGRRLWPAATAAVLALALLATTLVLSLRPTVTDADRSAAVGSARTTLESLLSYSGTTFDQHVAQVTPQLASPFREQFTKVAAADIKPMAVKNGATVQAKVYDAGVMDATGDGGEGTTVRVLAFVNQATTTTASTTPAIDQNRVIATMRKVGERWLVSDLAAF
jgi:Mce-associated membrane protein